MKIKWCEIPESEVREHFRVNGFDSFETDEYSCLKLKSVRPMDNREAVLNIVKLSKNLLDKFIHGRIWVYSGGKGRPFILEGNSGFFKN